jgi:DNA helicase HerA-like ATPase
MFQRCWNDALSSQNEKFYGKNRFRFWSLCQPNLSAIALPDDLRVVSGTLGDLPDATLKRIPKLARGKAILSSSQDILRHPVLIKIRERETPAAAPTPNLSKAVQQWRKENNQN